MQSGEVVRKGEEWVITNDKFVQAGELDLKVGQLAYKGKAKKKTQNQKNKFVWGLDSRTLKRIPALARQRANLPPVLQIPWAI